MFYVNKDTIPAQEAAKLLIKYCERYGTAKGCDGCIFCPQSEGKRSYAGDCIINKPKTWGEIPNWR